MLWRWAHKGLYSKAFVGVGCMGEIVIAICRMNEWGASGSNLGQLSK